jgi:hypothetical protein
MLRGSNRRKQFASELRPRSCHLVNESTLPYMNVGIEDAIAGGYACFAQPHLMPLVNFSVVANLLLAGYR